MADFFCRMSMRKTLCLLICLTTLAGCGPRDTVRQREKLTDPLLSMEELYFTGEYTYYADVATLKDCATGKTLLVAQKGDYLLAERLYTILPGPNMLPCYARLWGYLLPQSADSDLPPQLVITRFGEFDIDDDTRPTRKITGAYRLKNEPRIRLEMLDDYQFRVTESPGSPAIVTGSWGRISESVIVLRTPRRDDRIATIDWNDCSLRFREDRVYIRE